MPQIKYSGKTDIGLKRSNNEDVFLIRPELDFCVAADGIGGAAAGEIASRIFADSALKIFSNSINRSQQDTLNRVQQTFQLANKEILEHVIRHPDHKGMGCVAELLAFCDDGFIIGHVGDSRTYRFRKGRLEQLTQDHTLVQKQLDEGLISADNVKHHPLRHVVLQAVGLEEKLAPDVLKGKTFTGDLFLLCSDGLTDMVQDDQIQKILSSEIDIHRKTDRLIKIANTAGGNDNITVVLAAIP
jgi:protein phosphatase